MSVRVLKFGSSVLTDATGFQSAAAEVARRLNARLIVVVSAVAGRTDTLLASARQLSASPQSSHVARLLATGEDAAVQLMAIALSAAGIRAATCTAHACGIRTAGKRLDARPVGIDETWLTDLFAESSVAVIPGFVGRGADGLLSLLGRGGSDLTALFLAQRLGAECVLLKDVDGLYSADPHKQPDLARRYATAAWGDVARLGRALVQPKAVRFAERQRIQFVIAAPNGRGTRVGPGPSVVDCEAAARGVA